MNNVIPFQRRPKLPPTPEDIDATILCWLPLSELRELLFRFVAACPTDPGAGHRLLSLVADMLLTSTHTDTEAQKYGWQNVHAMHERGRDMLAMLQENPPQDGA